MPIRLPQGARIFHVSPTDTVQSDALPIHESGRNLVHSTRLPGGFYTYQFDIVAPIGTFWDFLNKRRLYHLLVQESGGRVIWDGRLERLELLTTGSGNVTVRLMFRGYWSNFTDVIDEQNHSALGAAIVQNLRDGSGANSPAEQLSTSNANITAVTSTLQLDKSATDRSAWDTITELLRYEDTGGFLVDLAVWEDRVIHYTRRDPSEVTWRASIATGDVLRMPIEWDWQDVANAMDGRYDSAGTPTKVGYTTDADSIALTIRREQIVGSIDLTDSTTATARRNAELTRRKNGFFVADGIELMNVRNAQGIERPLCHVRAGDVLRIDDLLPATARLNSATPNQVDTYVITETRCNHDRGTLTLAIDQDRRSLTNILASNGVRP